MANIKGVLLTAYMNFLTNRYGEKAVTEVLQTLEPEDRLLLSKQFLPSSWYPYSTLHALRKVTRALVTPTDRNLSVELGRYQAEFVFTGVYKTFLTKDPAKQVEKFSWIKDFFFQDARTLETEMLGATRCLVRYTYEPGASPTRAICESLGAFWSKTLELAGAPQIKSTHPKCVANRANCCEFIFEWEAPKSPVG
jgi:hypothetical protein